MDVLLLKYYIKKNGDTHMDLANALGINESSLYRKFKNDRWDFTLTEIRIMIERYKLTPEQVMDVFFRS